MRRSFKPHPARYPAELPEYFIRMLTERGDLVVDPFAGSCITGEVCERTKRRWTCIELLQDYCEAALGRFRRDPQESAKPVTNPDDPSNYYRMARPGILWNGDAGPRLPKDGGKKRRLNPKHAAAGSSQKMEAGSGDQDEALILAAAPLAGE